MIRKVFKISFLILGILTCLQFVTYSVFAKGSIISQLGKHYETYVLSRENGFEEILVGGNAPLDEHKVLTSFPIFKDYALDLCEKSPEECIEGYDWNGKGRYQYLFEVHNEGIFKIHTISEFEHASEYGARWESHYIWVLFKWVLISKENRGIS